MTQKIQAHQAETEQSPVQVVEQGADETLALQPGHVMQRQHYERLAREAAQK